ncbi:MAG: peptide ABC transporter substrate-binding protein [Verrucomicrobiales bacterium]|nr:peptide ABC transporter substrate-binding protein [Verrucomicrobiales bacterium]
MPRFSRLLWIPFLVVGVGLFHHWRQSRPSRVAQADEAGILLIGNGTDIESLDPHMATGQPEHHVITTLFEGLVAPAADDPDADAPGVATHWQSADFITWTFHLREDALWSDGTPLTSADFLYSWQRILSPALASDYAPMLYLMKNAQAYNEGRLTDFAEVGAIAPDAHTLVITLEGPAPFFPSLLKHYTWFPVPRHGVEKFGTMTQRDTAWARPGNLIGNGPFLLQDWRINHFISVTRNPRYWDAANVGLNGIRFFPIDNAESEERLFLDNQLHVTNSVPLAKIAVYRRERPTYFHQSPELSVEFYRCNTTRPPLNDERVRNALALALDRRALVEDVIRSGSLPATSLTPPGSSPDYPPLQLISYDPEKARQFLAQAGFPGGRGFRKIEILTNSSESARTIAEFFQESWKRELGLEISILQQEWQVYLDSTRKLTYDIARAGWVGDYTDPYTFLGIWRKGDGNNNTGWNSPAYDALLDASTQEAETSRRMATLRQAETLLMQQMPIIPVYWKTNSELIRPEVENWKPSVISHRCYKALRLGPYQPLPPRRP